MRGQFHEYQHDGQVCQGYVSTPANAAGKRPAVVIAHDWSGQNAPMRDRADKIAGLGYVGFALDVYGKGNRGNLTDDNTHLMQPFLQDRAKLRDRLRAGVDSARAHPAVDGDRIAVIGYCFGGLCALDVARANMPVRGVVSFHGIFPPPDLGPQAPIAAKILILHGWADPLATPADVEAVARELTEARADWQIHAYGHTGHAFTAAGVNNPAAGMAYNEAADRRSWQAMQNFLAEIFA